MATDEQIIVFERKEFDNLLQLLEVAGYEHIMDFYQVGNRHYLNVADKEGNMVYHEEVRIYTKGFL